MTHTKSCHLNGKIVEPCTALRGVISGLNPSGNTKGIFAWEYSNIATGEATRRMVGIKSEMAKNGLIFNYCPFCGQKIVKEE